MIAIATTQPKRRAYLTPLVQLGKLQGAALLATALDHTIMIVAVRLRLLPPASATAVGAVFGALVAFVLGRNWVFRCQRSDLARQLARYLLVAAISLVGNVAGEALLVRAGVHYALGRVMVAIVVGVLWNFPMQRSFVFGRVRACSGVFESR
jgi:putative flippase GtrA